MPRFDIPTPVALTVELIVADLRVIAGDRRDAVVDVRPHEPSRPEDVRAADETTVELTAGTLVVRTPKSWRHWTPFGGNGGTVDVTIEVPAGSRLHADLSLGSVRAEGRLGDCRIKTAMGDISVAEAGELTLKTSHGHITVDHGTGFADIHTGSGRIRVGMIDGPLVVRDGNGDVRVDEVTGDLRAKSSNGDIEVARASRSVSARTAAGDIRIVEVARGAVVLRTAAGEVDVGVREGTAAWLDVGSSHGSVRNGLYTVEGPGDSTDTVELRANTGLGDITIRRSQGTPPSAVLSEEADT